MSNLYQQLAPVYEAMYQSFIDYEEEFQFYSQIIKQYNFQQVVEIGSGTGHLAQRFHEAGFDYLGLDYSSAMIEIAQEKYPKLSFLQGDMRSFKLEQVVESIIVTARTMSYLISNEDVNNAFKSISDNLKKGGLLCFDFIDANRFIPAIEKDKAVIHEATYQGEQYRRESFWAINLVQSWTFDWQSEYFKIKNNKRHQLGTDYSTIRTFTQDDIRLFLILNGFEVKKMIDRPTYAFDTFVAVAVKL